jgi:hypothetical protein
VFSKIDFYGPKVSKNHSDQKKMSTFLVMRCPTTVRYLIERQLAGLLGKGELGYDPVVLGQTPSGLEISYNIDEGCCDIAGLHAGTCLCQCLQTLSDSPAASSWWTSRRSLLCFWSGENRHCWGVFDIPFPLPCLDLSTHHLQTSISGDVLGNVPGGEEVPQELD